MSTELKAAIAAVEGYLEKATAVPGASGVKFGRDQGGYMSYRHLEMVLDAAKASQQDTSK